MARTKQGEVVGGQKIERRVLDLHLQTGGVVHRKETGGLGGGVKPEAAIGVELEQGRVAHVVIVQRQAEQKSIGLDVGPTALGSKTTAAKIHNAINTVVEKLAGLGGNTIDQHILRNEHQLAGSRAVFLAEIGRRRDGVAAFAAQGCEHQAVVHVQAGVHAGERSLAVDRRHHAIGVVVVERDQDAIEQQATAVEAAQHIAAGDRSKDRRVVVTQTPGRHQGIRAARLNGDVVGVGAGNSEELAGAGVHVVTRQDRHIHLAVHSLENQVEPVVKVLAPGGQVHAVRQGIRKTGEWVGASVGGGEGIILHLQEGFIRLVADQVADDAGGGIGDVDTTNRIIDHIGCIESPAAGCAVNSGRNTRCRCFRAGETAEILGVIGVVVEGNALAVGNALGGVTHVGQTGRRGAPIKGDGSKAGAEAAIGVTAVSQTTIKAVEGETQKGRINASPGGIQHVITAARQVSDTGGIRLENGLVARQGDLGKEKVVITQQKLETLRNWHGF